MLVFLKVVKSKYYTNKFNEKDLFTARSLFKSSGRLSSDRKSKGDNGLKTIMEDADESYDAEKAKQRDTCQTIYEERSSNHQTTFSVPGRRSHIDGERLQKIVRRNHLERKTDEEPEIVSAFSQDRSEDYIIQPRKYKKDNYADLAISNQTNGMYKSNNYDEAHLFSTSNNQKKVERGVKNLQIKFNFSETESDEDLSENPEQDNINNQYGRQTIDLNGPIYDPSMLNKEGKACMSELGQAESEASDVNKILDQMESKSFKGFGESDLGNSIDSRLNEGAMLRSRRQNKQLQEIFM